MKSVAAKSSHPVRNHVEFTLPAIDKEIDNLDVQINEIIIEYEETQEITDQLIEKTDIFLKSLNKFFDTLSISLSEKQVNDITLICRKANENENFKLLLFKHRNCSNHHKIFFKKLDHIRSIQGDIDRLETENEDDKKKIEVQHPALVFREKVETFHKIVLEKENHVKVMEEVTNLLNESKFHYTEEHNIDKPFKIFQKLNALKDKYELDPKLGKFFRQIYEENASHFAEVKKEFDYLGIILKETEAKDWIHEKTKGKIHVYYKLPQGTPTCSMKFEAEIEGPIRNIASIVYECDLMHLWMPMVKISKTIKKINKACKTFYNEMDLPFISNREIFCVGYGINRLEENGTILIVSKSIDQDFDFQKKHGLNIPEKSKFVRVDMNYFIMEVTPQSETVFKIKMITNMNPKLKVIPISIINFMTRKFGIKIFEILVKKATKNYEKSPWAKSVELEENRDFYQWLDKSIIPFLKR